MEKSEENSDKAAHSTNLKTQGGGSRLGLAFTGSPPQVAYQEVAHF